MERVQKRPITRNRELRACTECRRRKLKCDRQLPCNACTKRNEATSCVYEKRFPGAPSQAEARLEHLEQLVQELSQSRQSAAGHGATTPTAIGLPGDGDHLANGSLLDGATHWNAMLEDIDELRNVIIDRVRPDVDDIDLEGNVDDSTNVLFGAARTLSFQEVLSQFLPLKHEADRLVAAYFRAKAIAAPFIHAPSFRESYRLFWNNPSIGSPLWTSMLFSIFDITTRTISMNFGAITDESKRSDRFAIAAAHCLAAGKYSRPQKFAVEALLLFVQSICLTAADMPSTLGILMGTVVRLATIMAYHRDPDKYREGISVFEGEMRRRTWSYCIQLDLLISFQLGLPTNIQFPTWDTKPPTNLLDSDFDETSVCLPPARPDSEPTELRFYIAKHRLMTIFEKVIRHTLSTTDRPEVELEMIEQELRETYESFPPDFKARSMADSVIDSPSVIVVRLCVSSIYWKCLCVLHRKYVVRGRQQSIDICHDSASNLVRQMLDMYEEVEPGGQLETEKWIMGSITWHDFLLACTALCLTLCSSYRIRFANASTINVVSSLSLLEGAKYVLEKHSTKSKDAQKVKRLVEATVLKSADWNHGSTPIAQSSPYIGQDLGFDEHWQAILSAQDEDWLWNDSMVSPADNTAWTSMDQFLDIPNGDTVTGI